MKKVGVGIVITFTFLIVCLVLLPARVVTQAIEIQNVALRGVAGTVWSGSLDLHIQSRELGRLQWQLQPSQLLQATLSFALDFTGTGVELEGNIRRNWSTYELTQRGRIDSTVTNILLSHYEIDITGPLQIKDLVVRTNSQLAVQDATARLNWDGGLVHYRLAGISHRTELPGLRGEVSMTDSIFNLTVVDPTDARGVLDLQLEPTTGEVSVHVKHHLINLADAPWRTRGKADAVALTISERLLDPFAVEPQAKF